MEIKKLPFDQVIDPENSIDIQVLTAYQVLGVANEALAACGIRLEPDYSPEHNFELMEHDNGTQKLF